jgi:hypothetical protein
MTGGIRQRARDNPRIEEPAPPDASGAPRDTRPTRWTGRLAGWIVPVENPAGVVYGIIAIGALMAAESGRHETYPDAVGSAIIAAGLYWLLHAYSNVLGRRLSTRGRLSAGTLWRALTHDYAIIRGAALPLFVLLFAWATGAARETAVTAAVWSAVASLIAFELLAGIRSRASTGELALEVGVGVAMGVAILGLKVVLH